LKSVVTLQKKPYVL